MVKIQCWGLSDDGAFKRYDGYCDKCRHRKPHRKLKNPCNTCTAALEGCVDAPTMKGGQ